MGEVSAKTAAFDIPKMDIVRENGYLKSITLDGEPMPLKEIISVQTGFDPSAWATVTIVFIAELTIRDSQ